MTEEFAYTCYWSGLGPADISVARCKIKRKTGKYVILAECKKEFGYRVRIAAERVCYNRRDAVKQYITHCEEIVAECKRLLDVAKQELTEARAFATKELGLV